MTISALVLTVSEDQSRARSALSAVRAQGTLTVGEPQGLRVPVVMDETGECKSIERFRWLEDLPGVESVEMVLAFFDDAERAGEAAFNTNRPGEV